MPEAKGKSKVNVIPLLNRLGDLATKDMEEVEIVTAVFISSSKSKIQKSLEDAQNLIAHGPKQSDQAAPALRRGVGQLV